MEVKGENGMPGKMVKRIGCLLLVLWMSTACGGGSSDNPVHLGDGDIIVNYHTLFDASPEIDQVSYTGRDASGNLVYGPVVMEVSDDSRSFSAENHDTARLANVPVHVTHLHTDYIDDGHVIGTSIAPVGIPMDGELTLSYPGDATSPVHLLHTPGSATPWQLICDGKPMFIKGVSFDYKAPDFDWSGNSLDSGHWFAYIDPDIGSSGANVIRTYGVPISAQNAEAQAKVISNLLKYAANAKSKNKVWVMAGIYSWAHDISTTEAFVKTFVQTLQKDPHYDHLLGYCVGNEVDPGHFGYINNLMGAAKSVMPTGKTRLLFHGTWSVGGTDTNRIKALKSITNMDVLGLNSYYGHFGTSVPKDPGLSTEYKEIVQAGWTGPFVYTEFMTYDWGSNVDPGMSQKINGNVNYLLELNSTDRSTDLRNNWNSYIAGNAAVKNGCLGGCALNWGPPHNSFYVGYWFAFYTYLGDIKPFTNPHYTGGTDFKRLDLAHTLAEVYGGSFPANHPPVIKVVDGDPQGMICHNPGGQSVKVTAASQGIAQSPGAEIIASVSASDADHLTFNWYLVGGSSAGYAGDILGAGQNPQTFGASTTVLIGGSKFAKISQREIKVGDITTSTITFNLPTPHQAGNNYQLRVVVHDTHNDAAMAAVAIRMK